MANDIVVRFVGEDKVTTVANKVDKSIAGVGSASTKSTAKVEGFSKALSSAAGGLGGMGGTITDIAGGLVSAGIATGTLGTALTALTGPVGIAVGVIAGLSAAIFNVLDAAARTSNQVENLKRGVITLAGSAEVGDELYSTLLNLASRTPFERQDIIEMAQSLLATGVEAKKVPGYIEAIGNAVATVGGGAEKVDSVTRAIGRMQASGKITNEQMMILTENGIDGFGFLSQQTGIAKEALIEMASKGTLPAKQNLDLLIRAMEGRYGDAMASQMGTATQSASNLSDAWQDLTAAVGGVFEPLVVGVYDATTAIVQGFTYAGQGVYDFIGLVSDFTVGLAIVTWTRSTELLASAWASVQAPVEAAWKSISDVGAAIGYYISESTTAANVSAFWDAVSSGAQSAYNWVSQGVTAVGQYVQASAGLEYIRTLWNDIWAAAAGTKDASSGAGPTTPFGPERPVMDEATLWANREQWLKDFAATFGDITKMTRLELEATGKAMGMWDRKNGIWYMSFQKVLDLQNEFIVANQRARDSVQTFNTTGAGFVSRVTDLGGAWVKANGKTAEATTSFQAVTRATDDSAEALRNAAQAEREYESNTRALDSVLNDLRGSYMDIADAQRSVESAQKALAEAQDPNRVLELNLALQTQKLDMDELSDSMDEMRKRREEIAKALKGVNEEQIRNNALTAAERRELNGLNASLDNLKKRREAVRKALAGNQLDPQQRVEFMATEVALTAAINQQGGQRDTLTKKQDDAIKKAQEDRIKLLEEDKKLQEDLERAQIRMQQAIITMTESQKALAEAQDPKRLEAYRDAVTKAELNLAKLREEQARNKVSADELSATLGVNSESFSALAESAGLTATPLDDLELRSGELSATLNGFDGTTALVGGLAGQLAALGADSADAVSGINNVGDALDTINGKGLNATIGANLTGVGEGISSIATANANLATNNLDAPLQSIKDAAGAIDTMRATAFNTWSNALTNAVNSVGNTDNVKKLINTLTALGNATSGTKNPLPYPGLSATGSGGIPDMGKQSTQNITINLNYASAPSSKNPLKDVEDYLAAQGGRLRI